MRASGLFVLCGALGLGACSEETGGGEAPSTSTGTGVTDTCSPGEAPNPAGGCCSAGTAPRDDGTCQPAGIPPDLPCPPGELAQAGGCVPAGIPPGDCATGFTSDGEAGCEPVLPAAPCPAGLMAIPGETECRAIAPCGQGTWGDIPVAADTQYVDGAYPGGDSDGSADRPWTTIDEAIDTAADGAVVAVAAGSYVEDLRLNTKPVRLWGRCPELVEIVGTGAEEAAILLSAYGDGSEVRDLAITGAAMGVGLYGAEQVVLDRLWIHDTLDWALCVEEAFHPSGAVLTGSLLEAAGGVGVVVIGGELTVEASVVRDTQLLGDGSFGRGLYAGFSPSQNERGEVTIRSSVVGGNREYGLIVLGSDAAIEASVVRDTQVDGDGVQGWGIYAGKHDGSGELATLTVSGSVVERNTAYGIRVDGASATIETSAIRDTLPREDGNCGRGVNIQCDPYAGERADVTLRSSLVADNHELGVIVFGSDVTIEATLVRQALPMGSGQGQGIMVDVEPWSQERADVTIRSSRVDGSGLVGLGVFGSDATIETTVVSNTVPSASGLLGRGVNVSADVDTGQPAHATIRHCSIENNHEAGLAISDSDVTVETTAVRGTLPLAGELDRGINVQSDHPSVGPTTVTLRSCLVENNGEIGVLVGEAAAVIETSVVRNTLPTGQGLFGDGVLVLSGASDALASAVVDRCLVESNARVGLASFGADVSLKGTRLHCNAIDLAAEAEYYGMSLPPTFHDLGGNVCGCTSGDEGACVSTSSSLQPPDPLGSP